MLGSHPEGEQVKIMSGRYGDYIKWNKINVTIPKEKSIQTLTLEESIALIDKNMPTIVIATNKINYDKIISNIQEIKSRKGQIIAIISKGDKEVKKIADYTIEVPNSIESITPFITVIPLQLLSYHIAVMLGKNVDQPRNLAKSVTVE